MLINNTINLYQRYGLDGQYIYFTPDMIDASIPVAGDVITNRKGDIRFYCIDKDVYRLWNVNSRDFVTGYDLYMGYKKLKE